MAKARRGDQMVEVADGQPLLAKPPTLQSETITNRFVEWEEGYAASDPFDTAEVIDDPVGIDQIRRRHNLTSGRVAMRRSA